MIFCFIGAVPATSWIGGCRDRRRRLPPHRPRPACGVGTLDRRPLPYETSQPGVFAVGDVRAGSVKRVAGRRGSTAVRASTPTWRRSSDGRVGRHACRAGAAATRREIHVTTTIRRSFAALCVLVALTGATRAATATTKRPTSARSSAPTRTPREPRRVRRPERRGSRPRRRALPVLPPGRPALRAPGHRPRRHRAAGRHREDRSTRSTRTSRRPSRRRALRRAPGPGRDKKADKAGDAVDDWANDNCDSQGDTKN